MPKVTINISATDDASSVLRKVSTEMEGLGKKTTETSSGFGTLGKFLAGGVIVAGIYKIGAASLKASAEMEQSKVAFTTMLGSADKAKVLLQDMTNFASNTPFELPQIVNAGKQMLAFGFNAKEVIPTLTKLGDVASGLSIPLNDLTAIYGKIKTSNKVMGDDLLQLGGRGIPIVEELAKVFNTGEENISKMASEGKIKFADLEKVMSNLTGVGSKFGGLMDAQAQTLGGRWSNFNDALEKSAVIIGDEIAPMAKDVLEILTNLAGRMGAGLGPDSISMTGSILKDINSMLNGTADQINGISESMDQIQKEKLIEDIERWEDTTEGVSKHYNEILNSYGQVNGAAALYSQYTKGNVQLTVEQVSNLEKILKLGRDTNVQAASELESWKQRGMIFDKISKTVPDKKPKDTTGDDSKRKDALKYYDDLAFKVKMAQATEEERITITEEKERQALEKRKGYLWDHYADAKALLDAQESGEREKLKVKQTADMYNDISNIKSKFYTDTANEEANALGEMSKNIVSSLQTMSSEISKVYSDIAADSKKNGLTMGDGFKIGASVAVAALQAVSAVLAMQSQMVQANYQKQLEALERQKESELEAIEEHYSAIEEVEEEKTDAENEARLMQLAAYEESLAGKTDAEINYALKRKKTELMQAQNTIAAQKKKDAEQAALDKKKAAEQKAIEQKYAQEKYKLELGAFKAKRDADKTQVKMSTALGVVQAWVSAMSLQPPPLAIAAGAILTGIMVGTAAKQLDMIDSQPPPSPPQFASGVTNFEGGYAIVGEKGREMITLPTGSNVITNENTEKLLGSSSSPQYLVNNIYLNGVLTQQEIVDLRKASQYGGY